MENVCRVCMDDSVPMVNIFSEVRDPALDQPNKSLSHILSECTNRPVKPDDCQPQFICLSCVQAAQIAFRFKRQCDRTYQHFCELQDRPSTTQDQDNQPDNDPQAEHKPVKRASRRSGGTNDVKLELPQSINGTDGMGKRFECPQCLKTYKSKHGINRHLLIHNSKPTHKCPQCSKDFWRKDTFKRHQVSCRWRITTIPTVVQLEHNVENPLSLPDITSSSIINADMINMETSLAARPSVYKHPCADCPESFDQEDDLKLHTLLNHDLDISSAEEESSTLGREEQPRFQTPSEESSIESSEDFPTSRQNESGFDQETHSSEQSEKQNRLRNSKRMRFGYPYCESSFNIKRSLKRPIATHDDEDPRICRHCGAIFSELSALELHLREHQEKAVHVPKHPDSKEYETDFEDTNVNANSSLRAWEPAIMDLSLDSRKRCDENQPTSSQRESGFDQDTHFSRQGEKQDQCLIPDGNKKWMACPHCPRRFQNKDSMQRHIYTHICQPRYKCPVCLKTYHRNDCYNRHLRTHNADGGAVYSCNQCPATFVDRFSLKRHIRKLHELVDKTQSAAKCRHCGKKYQKIKSLQKHERSHLVVISANGMKPPANEER